MEARNHADLRNTHNIVILPPSTSIVEIDSDVEDLPEQFNNHDDLFEPVGELLTEHEYSGGKDDEENNEEPV